MLLWQAKSIGLDQQTGEAVEEVLHLTRFRPITEPSNADKFSGRSFLPAIRNCSVSTANARLEAAIYSTPIAAFLLYPREELLPEWERLRTLSPDQFAATIVVD